MVIHHPKTYFTLIELLLVITILSILASLLLPMVAKTRSLARTTQCVNQMKNISMAMTLYQEENGGFQPAGYRYEGSLLGWVKWHHRIGGLLKGTTKADFDEIFICPGQESRYAPFHTDYTLTAYTGTGGLHPDWSNDVFVNIFNLCSNPEKTAQFFDGIIYDTWGPQNGRHYRQAFVLGRFTGDNNETGQTQNHRADWRHSGTQRLPYLLKNGSSQPMAEKGISGVCNFAFVDGHIESRKWGTISDSERAEMQKLRQ